MKLLHIALRSISAVPYRLRCRPRKAFTAAATTIIAIAAAIFISPKLTAQDRTIDSLFLHASRLLYDADHLALQRYFYPTPDTAPLRALYTRLIETLDELIEHDPSNLEACYLAAYAERRRIGPYDGDYITAPLSSADAALLSVRLERAVGWLPGPQRPSGRFYWPQRSVRWQAPMVELTALWGSLAYAYAMRGDRDSARWAFTQGRARGGFHEMFLETSRNTMMSCDSNAILFVSSDADIFPMWYLQMMERYRTDLTIVNLRLLRRPRHLLDLARRYPFGANPLPTSQTEESARRPRGGFGGHQTIQVPLPDGPDWGLRSIARLLHISDSLPFYLQGHYYTIESPHIVEPEDHDLVDIIGANRWRRHIAFARTIDFGYISAVGAEHAVRTQGMTWRLVPWRNNFAPMTFDDRFTLRLILNDRGFTWRSLGGVDSALRDESYRRHVRYSLTLFTESGWMRKRRGDTGMVRLLLERLERALPVDSFAWVYDRDRLPEVKMLYEYAGWGERYAVRYGHLKP